MMNFESISDTISEKINIESYIFNLNKCIKIYTVKHGYTIVMDLKDMLSSVGITSEIVSKINEYDDNLYIILYPQTITKVPKKYIIFQLEQVKKSNWINDAYNEKITNSICTLDYSLLNCKNHISEHEGKIVYQPMPMKNIFVMSENYEHDVLFFGALNKRRTNILNYLKTKFNIKILHETFGEELHNNLYKSKIVLNLHFYNNAVLETARLNETLRYNNIIISELPDNDDPSVEDYGDQVCFIDEIKSDLSNIFVLDDLLTYHLEHFNDITKQNIDKRKMKISELADRSLLYLKRNLSIINV
jgi:hypothetical protein